MFSLPPFVTIFAVQNSLLMAQVFEEEVKAALWTIGEDKAPDPDGFPPFFFRVHWDIIHSDVISAVQAFFQSGRMLMS